MGVYKNNLFENVANIGITLLIIVLSTAYGVTTLFPNLLK